MTFKGHTISGNDLEIVIENDEINSVKIEGKAINFDDLSEFNKHFILNQIREKEL